MASSVFVLRNGGVSISTAITILQIKAAVSYPIEILRASLTQRGSTTSAQERVVLLFKSAGATVTAASAGTTLNSYSWAAVAPNATTGTSATGITATSEGTDGHVLVDRGFNVLNGFEWLPTPEERILFPSGQIFAMKFLNAPAAQTWYAEICFREFN